MKQIIFSPENDCKEYSPTEISYGVKQLLMKYLPDEHLAKISAKSKTDRHKRDMHGTMDAKRDMSFASLQYMKKYNLLPPTGNFKFTFQIPAVNQSARALWS